MPPLKSIYGKRLVKGRVMVEWVELGEGWSGDYDPNDPEDDELLRFDVSYKFKGSRIYEDPGDCSYCTTFFAKSTPEERQLGLEYLMHHLEDVDFENGYGKKVCERLSWISIDWIKENRDVSN